MPNLLGYCDNHGTKSTGTWFQKVSTNNVFNSEDNCQANFNTRFMQKRHQTQHVAARFDEKNTTLTNHLLIKDDHLPKNQTKNWVHFWNSRGMLSRITQRGYSMKLLWVENFLLDATLAFSTKTQNRQPDNKPNVMQKGRKSRHF